MTPCAVIGTDSLSIMSWPKLSPPGVMLRSSDDALLATLCPPTMEPPPSSDSASTMEHPPSSDPAYTMEPPPSSDPVRSRDAFSFMSRGARAAFMPGFSSKEEEEEEEEDDDDDDDNEEKP